MAIRSRLRRGGVLQGTWPNAAGAPVTPGWFWPKMHKLGRPLSSAVHRADGSTEMVFDKDFDFNHQIHYVNSPMIVLQPGETITSTCTFDNTTNNPKNPSDPLKVVGWGEGTEDEMFLAFVGITLYREKLTLFSRQPLK